MSNELEQIAEFLGGLKLEAQPDEDTSVHPEIQDWYEERIKECLALNMKDVALAYHAHINRDERLSPTEKTHLLLRSMQWFTGKKD